MVCVRNPIRTSGGVTGRWCAGICTASTAFTAFVLNKLLLPLVALLCFHWVRVQQIVASICCCCHSCFCVYALLLSFCCYSCFWFEDVVASNCLYSGSSLLFSPLVDATISVPMLEKLLLPLVSDCCCCCCWCENCSSSAQFHKGGQGS